jgi:hypothetical protein
MLTLFTETSSLKIPKNMPGNLNEIVRECIRLQVQPVSCRTEETPPPFRVCMYCTIVHIVHIVPFSHSRIAGNEVPTSGSDKVGSGIKRYKFKKKKPEHYT